MSSINYTTAPGQQNNTTRPGALTSAELEAPLLLLEVSLEGGLLERSVLAMDLVDPLPVVPAAALPLAVFSGDFAASLFFLS